MAQIEAHKDLGQLLLEEGLIDAEHLRAAREVQRTQDKSIGRALVEMGLITEQTKITFLLKRFNLEVVDIANMAIPRPILTRISRSYAEKHRCVPILVEGDKLVVAMEDPTDILVLDEIKAQTGTDVLPVLAPLADIDKAIEQFPRLTQEEADRLQSQVRLSPLRRVVHPLLFLFVMLLPLLMFFVMVRVSFGFNRWVWQLGQPFDIALYLVLSWILWAILVWEIDGLLFGVKES